MGRTTEEDELDDLRANLAEDPDLADAFARLEAAKDSSGQRKSGSEFGNPLKGFVPVDSTPSQRPVSSRSGLPSLHDDDEPPDTPTRRFVKSEHPDLPDAPPSTHRTAFPPGVGDPKRGALPKPTPPPAKISSPGPLSSPRSKPNALVYGPVSSPNGATSSPDPVMSVSSSPMISVRNTSDPALPVNSGPAISVRNTAFSMPTEEIESRVTPVVGAPPTPLSPASPPAAPQSESPPIDSAFDLAPLAESVESEQMPELHESDARGAAPPVAAPAVPADESEGSGTRLWLLLAATLVSAAATVFVLMFYVRPLRSPGEAPSSSTAPAAATQAAAPPVQPTAVAPAPAPTPVAPIADTSAAPTAAPTTTASAAAPTSSIAGVPPTPGLPVPGQQQPPVAGAGTFVPQFTKAPPGAAPPTAPKPTAPKPPPTASTTAPKSTVSPIFEFEK